MTASSGGNSEHVAAEHVATDHTGNVRGRIVDLDGHVMFGPEVFAELLGRAFDGAISRWLAPLVAGITDEHRARAREQSLVDVGSVRGFLALGADDPDDRLLALDRLGIAQQLLLPPVSWPTLDDDRPGAGATRHRYNEWVRSWVGSRTRLVPTAVMAMHDPTRALEDAGRIVCAGFRAVEIPFAAPPGGRSPGDRTWDPLWELLAEAGVSVVLHLGGAGPGAAVAPPRQFLDPGWTKISHLAPGEFPSSMSGLRENALAGPVSLATLHIPAEVFLSSLVLAGVFERHPRLNVVVLEMGAQWVSSWVERLDGIASGYRSYALEPLQMLPSEVISRQVRVTPFERNDVSRFIERDGLEQVYAFASDFPHAEGGRDPVRRLGRALARLGPETTERFFVTNGSRVLPNPSLARTGATR